MHRRSRRDDYDYRERKRFRTSDYYEPDEERDDPSQCMIYVGNVAERTSGEELLEFLNQAMSRAGLTGCSGDAALSYRMNLDKHFCYVQFRTKYEARQALRLNDIRLHGHPLDIRPLDSSGLELSHNVEQAGIPYRDQFQDEAEEPAGGWMRTVHYNEEVKEDLPDEPVPGPSSENVSPVPSDDFEHPTLNVEQSCKVRVRHVPPGVTEEEVREFFNYFMKLTGYKMDLAVSCRMTNDVAIVQFATPHHAQQALGYSPLQFKNTYLVIEPVGDEPMPGVDSDSHEEEDTNIRANDSEVEVQEVEQPIKQKAGQGKAASVLEKRERAVIVENVHGVTKGQLLKFINKRLGKTRGAISLDKTEKDNYNIVQFKSPEIATAALGLDGVNFRGHLLKVVRLTQDVLRDPGQSKVFTNSRFDDKLVVSNLPNYVNRKPLRFFLDNGLQRKGLVNTPRPVLHMTRPMTRMVFALVFRTKEDARRALKLDGIDYCGKRLHFRKSDSFPKLKKGKAATTQQSTAAGAQVPALTAIPEGLFHILVSNYPRQVSEEQLRTFLNNEMKVKSLTLYPGDAIWPAAKSVTAAAASPAYAFAIFSTVQDATKGLALDGLKYKGHVLKVTRPRDYKPITEEEAKKLPPVPKRRMKASAKKLKVKNPELFENGPGYRKGLPLHPAYKLFIGDLTDRIIGDDLRQFLNEKMREKKASNYNTVKGVFLGLAAKSIIFQVRTFWEAKSAATQLDGTQFEGKKLTVKLYNIYKSAEPSGSLRKDASSVAQPPNEIKKEAADPPPAVKESPVSSQKAAIPPLAMTERPNVSPEKAPYTPSAVGNRSDVSAEKTANPAPAMGISPNFPTNNANTGPPRKTQVSYHTFYREPSMQSYRPAVRSYNPPVMAGPLMTFEANSFSSKYTWSISTWNVMGAAANPAVQAFLDETLFGLGMDLIAIQETGLDTGTLYTKNYKWYMSSSEDGTAPGVGFLLRRDLLPCAYEFNPKGGNLAHMQIKTTHQNLAVASVYVPPDSNIRASAVMDELKSFVSSLCSEDHILLLGDFNAEIGSTDLTQEDRWFIGQYLTPTHCNKNGMKLKEILHQFRMYLCSSEQNSTLFTWTDGVTYTQTDHVVANCKRLITSIRDIPMPSFRTYHKLLRASVRFTACDQHRV